MAHLFEVIFYQPILNLLVAIYNFLPGHDVGIVIIILTIIVRGILYPLSKKAIEAQKSLQNLQPKLEEIKRAHADNKEAASRAMMDLYKQEKVNPLSSCLPLIIQLPFFWAIFRVFRDELTGKALTLVYPFIMNPGTINPIAFGFLDFSKPNIVLAVLAGASQFWQAKMMPMRSAPKPAGDGAKDENMMAMMNKQMLYVMPALTVFICLSLPSGLAFYWLIATLLTILQQWWIFRQHKDPNSTPPNVIEGEIIK